MKQKSIAPKKILIINIFGIGDVLFTTPIIANLKAQFPDIEIGYMCNRRTVNIVERMPNVNTTFVYERDEFNAVYQKSKWEFLREVQKLLGLIKKEQFDTVIDLSLSNFTSFFTWWLRIPNRIGYNYKNRSFLLNQAIPLKGYESKHVVAYYLDLLDKIGVSSAIKTMEMPVPQEDRVWAEDFVQNLAIPDEKQLICIVPGGGDSWGQDAKFKRWPGEHYAKLADKLIENFNAAIILLGDKKEVELCEKVAQSMQNTPFLACGKTSIFQYAALVQKSALTIANDGGPLHVAVASGAKTLSIFGPVDENVYGPYPREGHTVVTNSVYCRPCYRRFRRAQCEHVSCLNGIQVEDVINQIELIFRQKG